MSATDLVCQKTIDYRACDGVNFESHLLLVRENAYLIGSTWTYAPVALRLRGRQV